MDRVTLMSDYGEPPGYNVDEYADRLGAQFLLVIVRNVQI